MLQKGEFFQQLDFFYHLYVITLTLSIFYCDIYFCPSVNRPEF